MTTPTPSVPPPADTPAPSVEASKDAIEETISRAGFLSKGGDEWEIDPDEAAAQIMAKYIAPLRQQLADVTKERDRNHDMWVHWQTKATVDAGELSRAVTGLQIKDGLLTLAIDQRDTLRAQLATAQQAQRDTATRAGMAEELAGALERTSKDLHDLIKDEQDDPSVGITGWSGLHEDVGVARTLLARFAALPKGRL